MKKNILGFAIGCALLTCFSGSANSQNDNNYDQIKEDIKTSIINIFLSDAKNGLQEIRSKEYINESDGSLIYTVESDQIKTYDDKHYILVEPGSTIGLYFAIYHSDPAILDIALKAFIEFGDAWSDEGLKNPFTVRKDEQMSKDGVVIYYMICGGRMVGMFQMDQNKKEGSMIIGDS